ncbi:MAG: outer membrane protein assembly factor BamD [Chloroflexota bacterium]|nr:MAG: outer membrane protein assembly factor BamD [Chloroflexota bacterium]
MKAQQRNNGSTNVALYPGVTWALIAVLALAALPGCAWMKDTLGMDDEKAEIYLPAEQLIMKGMDEYNIGKYYLAVDYFNEILDRYPFSPQAPLAELKAADSNYYLERYVEALVLYKEFEERHPTNEAIPYVMYQKGMCSYRRIDRIDRDITGAEESIRAFQELLRAYPVSPYSKEARARIKAANEFLVNHEFYVVKFYLRTERYTEAETRLKYILAMYPESKIAPRAQELLDLVQAGTPPTSGITDWFTGLSLPSWTDFTDWMD